MFLHLYSRRERRGEGAWKIKNPLCERGSSKGEGGHSFLLVGRLGGMREGGGGLFLSLSNPSCYRIE